jgi:hypothetical protein
LLILAQTHTIETCPAEKKLVGAEVIQTSALWALLKTTSASPGELDLCRSVIAALGMELRHGPNQGANSG